MMLRVRRRVTSGASKESSTPQVEGIQGSDQRFDLFWRVKGLSACNLERPDDDFVPEVARTLTLGADRTTGRLDI